MYFNLHLQPSPELRCSQTKLRGVGEVSAICLLSCRAAWQESVGRAAVLTGMLFCESIGWIPEGWGQLTQGLCVKLAVTGLFCPLFDPAARDPSICSPFPSFWFAAVSLLQSLGSGGGVFLNFERFNFLSVTSPASHFPSIAKGFNGLYYSEYAVWK